MSGNSGHSPLSMVKDVGLGLIQAGALFLTINLALVTLVGEPTAIDQIKGLVVTSSILLGVSLFLGMIGLSLVIEMAGSNQESSRKETAARWLTGIQLWAFVGGMAIMIKAVYDVLF